MVQYLHFRILKFPLARVMSNVHQVPAQPWLMSCNPINSYIITSCHRICPFSSSITFWQPHLAAGQGAATHLKHQILHATSADAIVRALPVGFKAIHGDTWPHGPRGWDSHRTAKICEVVVKSLALTWFNSDIGQNSTPLLSSST